MYNSSRLNYQSLSLLQMSMFNQHAHIMVKNVYFVHVKQIGDWNDTQHCQEHKNYLDGLTNSTR